MQNLFLFSQLRHTIYGTKFKWRRTLLLVIGQHLRLKDLHGGVFVFFSVCSKYWRESVRRQQISIFESILFGLFILPPPPFFSSSLVPRQLFMKNNKTNMCLSQLSLSEVPYTFWKEPYRTTRISTVAKWDYGSGENQYWATRFSTIAKWERGSGRTMGSSQGLLYVSISRL